MDTGRQSGGGRVVVTFYDLRSEIWSGSPATGSMEQGFESGNIAEGARKDNSDLDSTCYQEDLAERLADIANSSNGDLDSQRHQTLLALSKEDMPFKKDMFNQMEVQDERFNKSMDALQGNMVQLTNVISNSLNFLTRMMVPQHQQQFATNSQEQQQQFLTNSQQSQYLPRFHTLYMHKRYSQGCMTVNSQTPSNTQMADDENEEQIGDKQYYNF